MRLEVDLPLYMSLIVSKAAPLSEDTEDFTSAIVSPALPTSTSNVAPPVVGFILSFISMKWSN